MTAKKPEKATADKPKGKDALTKAIDELDALPHLNVKGAKEKLIKVLRLL